MYIFLALIAAVFAAVNTLSVRVYQSRLQYGQSDLWGFQACYFLVGFFAYFALCGFAPTLEPSGWLLAVGMGVCLAVANVFGAACYVCGPMSLTGVIANCSVILPVMVGCLVYHERLAGVQILGIALLLTTLLVSVEPSKADRREISPRWYLCISLTFLSSGLASVMMNVYSKISAAEDRFGFLTIAYLAAALCLVVCACFGARGQKVREGKFRLSAFFCLLVMVASLGAFASDALILWLNSLMPASLLYPLLNGATAIMVCIASCVCFKERLTVRKTLAILAGVAAIIVLNL